MVKNNELIQITVLLRAIQIFYHAAHNTIYGPTFVADHGLLGDFYPQAEEDYDSVAERFIGLNGADAFDWLEINQKSINFLAHNKADSKKEAEEKFSFGLLLEGRLIECCGETEKAVEYSFGTKQLIGDVANRAEMRVYKIKQRLC